MGRVAGSVAPGRVAVGSPGRPGKVFRGGAAGPSRTLGAGLPLVVLVLVTRIVKEERQAAPRLGGRNTRSLTALGGPSRRGPPASQVCPTSVATGPPEKGVGRAGRAGLCGVPAS